jgi:hypothetical protein
MRKNAANCQLTLLVSGSWSRFNSKPPDLREGWMVMMWGLMLNHQLQRSESFSAARCMLFFFLFIIFFFFLSF